MKNKDTHEGMLAGLHHPLKSVERAMVMEEATKKGPVQEFLHKRLQRRQVQPMAGWVNVFEKSGVRHECRGLNVELKSMGWHLFEKSNLTLELQERVLGAAEVEYDIATICSALVKLFPDSTINQETRSPPERKPGHSDRFRNRFHKARDG